MRFLTLITFTFACFLPSVLASPSPLKALQPRTGHPEPCCLTDKEAADIVKHFTSLFTIFNEAEARATLAKGFTEYSDSLNFLQPNTTKLTGDAVVSGLENFIAYRKVVTQIYGNGPPFQVIKIIHTCDSISFLWRQNIAPVPTQGIDILYLDKDKKVVAEYTEFNTLAYLANAGCQFNCPPGPS